jgi:hypothetical protein
MDVAQNGRQDRDETGKLDKEHVMRSKLTVETIQWQMARLDPRRWAEKALAERADPDVGCRHGSEQREALVQSMLKRLEIIARAAMLERERRRQLGGAAQDDRRDLGRGAGARPCGRGTAARDRRMIAHGRNPAHLAPPAHVWCPTARWVGAPMRPAVAVSEANRRDRL